jgi:hypothetical protein
LLSCAEASCVVRKAIRVIANTERCLNRVIEPIDTPGPQRQKTLEKDEVSIVFVESLNKYAGLIKAMLVMHARHVNGRKKRRMYWLC